MAAARTLVCSAVLPLALLAASRARAEDAAKEPAHKQEKIEVSRPKDYDERRESTAAKIVVGRDELQRFGDATLEDVLKRLPGVTVSASGGISLRGLGNGYTQVLLDGQPLPPGFSIESLSPDMIERIEIFRAPTAEHSTQAVAGTINIVLRKAASHLKRSAKMTAGAAGSRPQAKIDAEISDRVDKLAYTVTASAGRTEFDSDALVEQVGRDARGRVDSIIVTPQGFHGRFDQASLAPRLEWTLGEGHTLAWESFVQAGLSRFIYHEEAHTSLGPPPVYPVNDLAIPTHFTNARTSLAWSRALAAGARAESKFLYDYSRRHYEAGQQAYDDSGAHILDRNVHSVAVNDNLTWTGKYTAPFVPEHALSFGWDAKSSRRGEDRVQTDVTFDGNPPGLIDESYDARVRQLALYGQDEWDFASRASAYLGLRWEGLDTRSVGNVVTNVENRSSVFSPIVQGLWKLPGTEKDQVRAALARTYRAPTPFEIMPRRYIANNNTATSPDYQGNAELRPEISWGLDVAYEHYFTGGGNVSVSGYARRIDDVIVRELFNQAGVWITRPTNDGQAVSRGIELDAKLPLRTFFPGAPAIQLHGNASRHWSRVEAIPGPDNRLVQQPGFTANAGLDYEAAGLPLSLGGNLTFTSGGAVRTATTTSVYRSRTRNLDLYALWKIDAKTKLRISGSNLLGDDVLEVLDFFDESGSLQQTTTTPVHRTVRALLEMQF
ncbi:MAG TPA: TonB-dependent receptor [Usitatibacter sp.]|jgi:outer membrane receptor protein involved in Fe transport|nr:TonB-dependent receptor [Usitatibacter sp.]